MYIHSTATYYYYLLNIVLTYWYFGMKEYIEKNFVITYKDVRGTKYYHFLQKYLFFFQIDPSIILKFCICNININSEMYMLKYWRWNYFEDVVYLTNLIQKSNWNKNVLHIYEVRYIILFRSLQTKIRTNNSWPLIIERIPANVGKRQLK